MTQSEFDELVVVNAALNGKYAAIVAQLSALFGFTILEDFGPRDKVGDFRDFIAAIRIFHTDLTTFQGKCNDRWLDAKFLTAKEGDPTIKGLKSLSSFFMDENNLGHSFFRTIYFQDTKSDISEISGGITFYKIWETIICSTIGILNPILKVEGLGDVTTLTAVKQKAIEKGDGTVFSYFTSNYGKQFKKKPVNPPKTKELFNLLSELYDKCYTLTEADYKIGMLAFEIQCNTSLSAAKKSKYKDCTVLAKQLKSKIHTAFNTLSGKEAVFPIIGKVLIDAVGNENLSLDLISDKFKNLNLPAFDAKRGDGLIAEPTYIQDVLSEIDLQTILESSLDEKESCFIEKEEGLATFKDNLSKAIRDGFLEDLNVNLGASSVNYIPDVEKVQRAITFWFSEKKSYPTYALFLAKIETKIEQIYSEKFIGIDDLKKTVAEVFSNEAFDIHPLAVSMWAEIGKENCLKHDYNALADLYFPNPTLLKQQLERSTIGISKKEFIEDCLPKWKTAADIFVGEGIKAIRNYNFESTKFKIKDFTTYLKDKVFTKDERAKYLANLVLSSFGEDSSDHDLKEKETTEALTKVWKAALVQFDEKAYFTELYDKYILSQDERVLLDFKNRIHFILPNKEDFEFALLSAVMNHSAKKGTSNSTWLSVESYKMQRSDAENWLERTKFAIDSFYECVHYIRRI